VSRDDIGTCQPDIGEVAGRLGHEQLSIGASPGRVPGTFDESPEPTPKRTRAPRSEIEAVDQAKRLGGVKFHGSLSIVWLAACRERRPLLMERF